MFKAKNTTAIKDFTVVINNKKQVLNQEMLKLGMAWHFKKYSSDPLYAQLEITARKNKVGLSGSR